VPGAGAFEKDNVGGAEKMAQIGFQYGKIGISMAYVGSGDCMVGCRTDGKEIADIIFSYVFSNFGVSRLLVSPKLVHLSEYKNRGFIQEPGEKNQSIQAGKRSLGTGIIGVIQKKHSGRQAERLEAMGRQVIFGKTRRNQTGRTTEKGSYRGCGCGVDSKMAAEKRKSDRETRFSDFQVNKGIQVGGDR